MIYQTIKQKRKVIQIRLHLFVEISNTSYGELIKSVDNLIATLATALYPVSVYCLPENMNINM